ncbi:MAG: type II toxin-antitoxin system RelE/ParE family toxin [Pirellulaceae bacterium]|nr:type II toxin-antitoxin system RelE/ParE family toxin [Pirellulaceae bacterium]
MPPIDYLPGARRDFDESFDWYAEGSAQAAVRFAAAVDAALERVAANPAQFASPDGVHRECPIKKFPFRIVYRLVDKGVLVVAIYDPDHNFTALTAQMDLETAEKLQRDLADIIAKKRQNADYQYRPQLYDSSLIPTGRITGINNNGAVRPGRGN